MGNFGNFAQRLNKMGYQAGGQRAAAHEAGTGCVEAYMHRACINCAHSSWQAQSPRIAGGNPSRVLACRQAAGAYVHEMSLCQQWQSKEGGAV